MGDNSNTVFSKVAASLMTKLIMWSECYPFHKMQESRYSQSIATSLKKWLITLAMSLVSIILE